MFWAIVGGLCIGEVAWRIVRFTKRIGSAFHHAIETEEADMWR